MSSLVYSTVQRTAAAMRAEGATPNAATLVNRIRSKHPRLYAAYGTRLDPKLGLPPLRHGRGGTSPRAEKRRRAALRAEFLWARKVLIYGEPVCATCGSHDGPMFRNTRRLMRIADPWVDFCCDSCSKGSERTLAKRRATCRAKYGVDNVAKTRDFAEQSALRLATRTPAQKAASWRKAKQTHRKKHGSLRAAMQARNAVSRATNLRVRGVEWPMQDADVMYRANVSSRSRKELTLRGKTYTGLQGYEPIALEFMLRDGCRVVEGGSVKNPTTVPYCHGSIDRKYHPDFRVVRAGREYVVEVKSTYTAGLSGVDARGYFTELRAKARAVEAAGEQFRLALCDTARVAIVQVTSRRAMRRQARQLGFKFR